MSIVTMSMSEYTIEPDDSMAVGQANLSHGDGTQYGDEVLYAGWNPSLALQQHIYTETSQIVAMPRELATADVESFLNKMYAYQR